MRARLLLTAIFVAAPCVFAFGAGAPVLVSQIHRAFSIREIHIGRGGTVRFSNADEFLHHLYVNSPTFKFSSSEQSPGQLVDIQFPTDGTFDVRCEIHPKMVATVIVQESSP